MPVIADKRAIETVLPSFDSFTTRTKAVDITPPFKIACNVAPIDNTISYQGTTLVLVQP